VAIEVVREYFKQFNRENHIIEHQQSTATVQEAADALNVIPARIAKTLSFKVNDEAILIVAAGDAKIENAKFKAQFGTKAKMLTPDEVLQITGHAVGGVCPFGLTTDVPVYLDASLKRFTTVFPACGSSNSSIELSIPELEQFAKVRAWVSVTKDWDENILE